MKEDVKWLGGNGLPIDFDQMKKQIGVEDVAKFLAHQVESKEVFNSSNRW